MLVRLDVAQDFCDKLLFIWGYFMNASIVNELKIMNLFHSEQISIQREMTVE